MYVEGRASYEAMAGSAAFCERIERLRAAMADGNLESYTIGFTRTTAEEFFGTPWGRGSLGYWTRAFIAMVNSHEFAKMPDFEYFLTKLTSSAYQLSSSLMPS
jgi:hypothetical protein